MRRITLTGLGLVLLGACATENPGTDPDRSRFYFPSALTLDPQWPLLYLANSNADLKYNGSTINIIRLDAIPDDLTKMNEQVKSGALKDLCHTDPFDPTVWECYEEKFIDPAATIRIGNFPADLRVTVPAIGQQTRERRLFVPVRGDNVLLWADVVKTGDPNVVNAGDSYDLRCSDSCPAAGDCPIWICDDNHKVSYSSEDKLKQLPSEPYGIEYNPLAAVLVGADGSRRTCLDGALPTVSCDCSDVRICDQSNPDDKDCYMSCEPPPDGPIDHLYVSHALNGEISLFTSDPSGVWLRDFRGGFFTPVSNVSGGFGLSTLRPGDHQSLTYASSRVNGNLASFTIMDDRRIVDATRAPIAGALNPANDVRGIAFGPGGTRLYALDRLPDALVALDMTPNSGAELPRQEVLWAVPVCSGSSVLRLGPDPTRPDNKLARLAYVVCFDAGQIYVVDTSQGKVVDIIVTGIGPNGLSIDSAKQRAFVANFLDNTVGVIDLNPAHPSYNRMVARIGHNQYLIRTQ